MTNTSYISGYYHTITNHTTYVHRGTTSTVYFICKFSEVSITIISECVSYYTTLNDRTSLSVDNMTELLRCCTTYFVLRGEFYMQIEWVAMGSPVSPIMSNLIIDNFETCIPSHIQWNFWGGEIHMDNTFVIIKSSLKQQFTDHMNAQHSSIKFTMENQVDNKLAILDVLVSESPEGNISFSVYCKPTHTDHYLKFASHKALEQKLGFILTLRHRATITVSNYEEKIKKVPQVVNGKPRRNI